MADLSNLESKLAEVFGLAQAAQDATETVAGLLDGESAVEEQLQRMHAEAIETENRCIDFLTMAETGEVGHWAIDWAMPVQERHYEIVRECSLKLAAREDKEDAVATV